MSTSSTMMNDGKMMNNLIKPKFKQ